MGVGISTTVTDIKSQQINNTVAEYSSTCTGGSTTQNMNVGQINIGGSTINGGSIASQSATVNYECVIDNEIEAVAEALSKMDAKARAENSAGFLQANINTNVTSVDEAVLNNIRTGVNNTCESGDTVQTMNALDINIKDSTLNNVKVLDQTADVSTKCKLSLLSKLKNSTQKELSVDTSSGGNIITTLITGLVLVAVLIAVAIFAYKFANSEGGQKVIQAGIKAGATAAGGPVAGSMV